MRYFTYFSFKVLAILHGFYPPSTSQLTSHISRAPSPQVTHGYHIGQHSSSHSHCEGTRGQQRGAEKKRQSNLES